MLFLRKPTRPLISSLLADRAASPFSYLHVGATRNTPPAGWRINHLRKLVSRGRAAHENAVKALFAWKLLAIDGLQVIPSTPTLQAGTNVAILSRHFGIWSVDFCRVIYVLHGEPENGGSILRSGFGYGTLPGHAVRGEEVFSIEWHPVTEEVWYDIYSFSRAANPLIALLAPIARATQRRFARGSLEKAARMALSK